MDWPDWKGITDYIGWTSESESECHIGSIKRWADREGTPDESLVQCSMMIFEKVRLALSQFTSEGSGWIDWSNPAQDWKESTFLM